MGGSLLVLDVWLLIPGDTAVGEFWGKDGLLACVGSAGASPVPVHSADELETGDLLICEVSDNLQHFSTVAIKTENLEVHETGSVHSILEEKGPCCQACNQPLSILSVLPKLSLHLNNY